MKNRISKRWLTAAGLTAVVQEGKETVCHVGVTPKNMLWGFPPSKAVKSAPKILEVCISGLSRSGRIKDLGLPSVDDYLWWFSFSPGPEMRMAEIEHMAEGLARVLLETERG